MITVFGLDYVADELDKNGKVKDVIVLEGPEALREAADRCARTSVWKPAVIDNKPIEVWVMMPITFKTH